MEKKFKLSDKPLATKIIYGAVIAILCITAVVIGIATAASKPQDTPEDPNPPSSDNGDSNQTQGDGNQDGNQNGDQNEGQTPKPLCFISPAVGSVMTGHSLEIPVFNVTLGAWKMHAGLDIGTEDGAPVYAAEDGTVTNIYKDPMLGYTVEITHSENIKTRYSNLANDPNSLIKIGDEVKSGDRIGTVGDSSVSELAEEPHLHFEMLDKDVKVDPLKYISEESKEASLGITPEGSEGAA